MTGPKTKKVGITYHGSVPATDPRYQSGWNFLSGKNLNPQSAGKSREPSRKAQDSEQKSRDQK